jgi:uncharacterized protein (DUF433 family)
MNDKNGQNEEVVIQTGRGPTINGTRITLYAILDELDGGTPDYVQGLFELSDETWAGVLRYLEAHRDELEREWAEIQVQNEAERRYWEERNKEVLSRLQPGAYERLLAAREQVLARKQGQTQNGACKSSQNCSLSHWNKPGGLSFWGSNSFILKSLG